MALLLKHGIQNCLQLSRPSLTFSGSEKIFFIVRSWWRVCGVKCRTSSSSTSRNKAYSVVTDLEKKIDIGLKSGDMSTVFQRLNEATDNSLIELKKRTWGDVFYSFHQSNEFDKLDTIRKRAKDLGINCGEGAQTTLINSYITRGKITEAAVVLNEMKTEGLLRHSRTYFTVITSLAKSGFHEKAFELFNEMQHHVFKSKKNVSLAVPSSMPTALIRSCIQEKNNQVYYQRAKVVLMLYSQSGWPLTLDVLKATKDWLSQDPIKKWSVKQTTVSEKGLCNICNQYLDSGLLTPTEKRALRKNILSTVPRVFKEKDKRKRMSFQKYREFLCRSGPYEVIIDGMSIGLSSNVKKIEKKFNFGALYEVAHEFVKQDKKVLVVVNSSIQKFPSSENLDWFITDVSYDDLFIIYACATWCLKPYIVTRDKLRDHRFIFDFHNRPLYLKWIRIHTIRVGVKKNILTFKRQLYDPVLQEGISSWHLPVVGGHWFCAQET